MKKVPTAKKFFKEKYGTVDRISISNAILLAVEYAKLHVKAALKDAAKKSKAVAISDYAADRLSENDIVVDQSSILNAYPEKLIK